MPIYSSQKKNNVQSQHQANSDAVETDSQSIQLKPPPLFANSGTPSPFQQSLEGTDELQAIQQRVSPPIFSQHLSTMQRSSDREKKQQNRSDLPPFQLHQQKEANPTSKGRTFSPFQVIQRKPLTAADVLKRMEKIDFIKNALQEGHLFQSEISSIEHRNKVETDAGRPLNPTGATMKKHEALTAISLENHVQRVIDNYSHFSGGNEETTNDAMVMIVIIKNVARKIADGLNNPMMQPLLVAELMNAYKGEIINTMKRSAILRKSKMANQKKAEDTFKIAMSLAGDDPITSYMKGKITLEDTVWRIRVMAHQGNMLPKPMFDLLSQQFQMEIGAYKQDEVEKGTLNPDWGASGSFDLKELIGEMSKDYLQSLVGTNDPSFGASGLNLTADASAKLQKLETEVAAWKTTTGIQDLNTRVTNQAPRPINEATDRIGPDDSTTREAHEGKMSAALGDIASFDKSNLQSGANHEAVALPGERGLTENQYGFLRDIRKREQELENKPDPNDGNKTPRQKVVEFISDRYEISADNANVIIAKAQNWFQSVPLTISVKGNDLFSEGDTPKYGNQYKAAQEIAKGQLSKEQMSGLIGKNTNTSVTNVANADEDAARGKNYLRWRMEKDIEETEHRGFSAEEQAIFGAANINFDKTRSFEGELYYGETHFVLKQEVRKRAAFNFNKTKILRSDIILTMYDIIINKNQGGSKPEFIDAIVNNSMQMDNMAATPNLQLEIEIFGELDITKDVAQISIPAATDKGLSNAARINLNTFANNHGIAVTTWDDTTFPAVVNYGGDFKQNLKDKLEEHHFNEEANRLGNLPNAI